MTYKTKVAVFSDIRTKQSTQCEHHVEFFIFKTGGTQKKPLVIKRLMHTHRYLSTHARK
jgi:hypothetical protein